MSKNAPKHKKIKSHGGLNKKKTVFAASLIACMTLSTSAASAAVKENKVVNTSASTVESSQKAKAANNNVSVSVPINVPLETVFALDVPHVTVVIDPPPPPPVVIPEPAPAPEPEPTHVVGRNGTAAASRSTERVAAPEPSVSAQEEVAATSAPAPAPSAASGSLADIAMSYVGVPYVSGGTSPSGFDCSGLTSYVYAQAGISIPRTSDGQKNAGTVVSRADALPGDIIWTPGHVAIYMGGNMQVDAPKPGASVSYRGIWQSNPTFIRIG